jgi:hypothetical protein
MSRRLHCWLGVGVTAFALVACGSGEDVPGRAGQGASTVQVVGVKSEFRTQAGLDVACNTVKQRGGGVSTQTGFAVTFRSDRPVKSATVTLRGQPTSQYDALYTQTAAPGQLGSLAGGTYRVLLSANATSAVYLSDPSRVQTLTVRPPDQTLKVKVVRVSNRQGYSFSPEVRVNSAGTSESGRFALSIPVYDTCTVLSTDATPSDGAATRF